MSIIPALIFLALLACLLASAFLLYRGFRRRQRMQTLVPAIAIVVLAFYFVHVALGPFQRSPSRAFILELIFGFDFKPHRKFWPPSSHRPTSPHGLRRISRTSRSSSLPSIGGHRRQRPASGTRASSAAHIRFTTPRLLTTQIRRQPSSMSQGSINAANKRTSGNGAVALWFSIRRLSRAVPERYC